MRDACRDAINPIIIESESPKSIGIEILSGGQFLYANDEWIQIVQSNIAQNGGRGVIFERDGRSFVASEEPFFVAGKQTLMLAFGTADVWLQRAPRREMLSQTARTAASGSAYALANTPAYFSAFVTPAITLATQWCYLAADGTWQVALKGQTPNGMPFGWAPTAGPFSQYSGRYYDIAVNLAVGPGGNQIIYYAPSIDSAGGFSEATGIQCSTTGGKTSCQVTVGDETNIGNPATGRLETWYGSTLHSQMNVKSARAWTIGIEVGSPGAGAVVTGFMSVLRRGG